MVAKLVLAVYNFLLQAQDRYFADLTSCHVAHIDSSKIWITNQCFLRCTVSERLRQVGTAARAQLSVPSAWSK